MQDWMVSCRDILDMLMMTTLPPNTHFVKPVCVTANPSYVECIKPGKPMDLKIVQKKLEDKAYATSHEFAKVRSRYRLL